jgi:hypothetical protein
MHSLHTKIFAYISVDASRFSIMCVKLLILCASFCVTGDTERLLGDVGDLCGEGVSHLSSEDEALLSSGLTFPFTTESNCQANTFTFTYTVHLFLL